MVEKLIYRLYKSGWKKEDIRKAIDVIRQADAQKNSSVKFMDKLVYWIFILIVILINLGISAALIPVIIGVSGGFFYFIIALIGISFGLLAEIAVRSMEHLGNVHHATLSVIMPVAALFSFIAIGTFLNIIKNGLGILIKNDVNAAAVLFSVSFALPYLVYRYILKKGYYG